jgi:hypothetical protein
VTHASRPLSPYPGPAGDERVYMLPRDLAIWEAAWAAHLGQRAPVETLSEAEATRLHVAPDMSPEAVAARAEAKRRHAEAIAYVASYAGSWGLPLDVRANPRWGSKHLKLTERQVDALLAGRDRDIARAAEAQVLAESDPLTQWLLSGERPQGTFLTSLSQQVASGRVLSPRQREIAERIRSEASTPAPAAIEPGMYQSPDGTVFKVQLAVHGSGRPYAKRLVLDEASQTAEFVYVPGGLREVKAEWRMTLDQASAFGKLYGVCCVCGRTLTDERSIAAGIGPICGRRV